MRAYVYLLFLITCLTAINVYMFCATIDYALLAKEEKYNTLGEDGLTSLMRAFFYDDFEKAKRVLEKRPFLTIKSCNGSTVFDLFLQGYWNENQKIILSERLVNLAIEQNIFDSLPEELLELAGKSSDEEFHALLISQGYKLNEHTSTIITTSELNTCECLQVTITSMIVFYLFIWLFLEELKPSL